MDPAHLSPAYLVTHVFRVLLKAYSKVVVALVVEGEWIPSIVLLSDGPQSDSVSQVQISDFMCVFRLLST